MKLAFSSLGTPELTWNEMAAAAKDTGFDGLEVRGWEEKPLTESDKAKLLASSVTVACVACGQSLQYPETQALAITKAKKAIVLAGQLGARYVRLLADRTAAPEDPVDDAEILSAVKLLLPEARENHVILLIETNGVFADTKRLFALLSLLGSDHVGALWDFHHPYRFFGESPAQTVANLGAFIKYVHCKDSVFTDGAPSYKLMGEGDLPFADFLRALESIKYNGFICYEWLKRYTPELEDAGIAFPQFVDYMKRLGVGNEDAVTDTSAFVRHETHVEFHQDDPAAPLQMTSRGGAYIWPKEYLVDMTFPRLLDRVAALFPDQYAFRYTQLDYTRTYAEFRDDVNAFARSLIALGVKPGDHVAIWATNVPSWYLTFWAAVRIGAVLVTVNTAYKIHEAEYLLRQSDTHTLVMIEGHKDSDYAGIIRKLCPELEDNTPGQPLHAAKLPFLRNVITDGFEMAGCVRFADAAGGRITAPAGGRIAAAGSGRNTAAALQTEVDRRAAACRPDDVCNMQYTSGTTGFPKGVMLTHNNIINDGKTIGDGMDLSIKDKMMIQVPMFHCFGMVLAMTACVTHGTTMCPIPAFSPSKGLDCINREQITCFHGVPTMFIAMLANENFENTDFSHMRTGIMAGSPCPVKVMEEVIEKMHMTEIVIVFGQTESSPGATMSRTTDSVELRVNTVGSAFYGVECKIVDPETGADLPDNTDGEFVCRGYNIMRGYYKMPEATAAAIDKDGWLHTGDLCRRLPDGNYKVTGRIKDMIIRGGENIYPKEIEDFIYTHPKVSDVQVIGVPDKAYGEEIMAVVIPKAGITVTESAAPTESEITEAEIKQFVMDNMAKHKVPRYVDFTDAFPMNAAGKILKYKMRADAVERRGLQAASKIVTA
ncbi:MAG: AMP-binding protein [Oscillospiraceae bacterium]|jgi:fatty-acyl-CoA synthase|nr:AMP-binding protein [Oscillospiraceae bacterium]